MLQKLFLASLIAAMFVICSSPNPQGQERKSGTLTGVVKSAKPTPNGRNVILEVSRRVILSWRKLPACVFAASMNGKQDAYSTLSL
jgi:hypothetical protein